jgi:ABC-2 type transport system permease protein
MTAPVPAARAGATTTASGPGGSIYDLGYQGYHGPRLGRRSASVALFRSTLRAAYGIGRGGRAKLAPLALAGLAILPAILAVGIAALLARAGADDTLEGASPVRYDTYHGLTVILVMLFCAAQAPELFGRDQRYGVLPLYFSRVLTRTDYALARVAGLIVALLVVDLLPQAILFVGRVLVASDPATGLSNEAVAVPRFLAQGLLTTGLLGGLSALIAAWSPRRSYATAGIIAVSIIPPAMVALLTSLTGSDTTRLLVLLSPGDILDGANAWIFGAASQNQTIAALGLSGQLYVVTAIVVSAVAIALTVRRYRRIAT